MQVAIDQDLCTGDGLCEEICPAVFGLVDGIAYVRGPDAAPVVLVGSMSATEVEIGHLDAVIDAVSECPGECIFVES